MSEVPTFTGDFQVCMMGGSRDKWTRILANFKEVCAMNIACDKSHTHAPWGFAKDESGRQVWVTSSESQYPKKMCVVLTSVVLQVAESRGLKLKDLDLASQLENPLTTATSAQMGSKVQPRPSKIPPVVPDFSSVAVFYTSDVANLPCNVMSKLSSPIQLYTETGILQDVPANSRLLRYSATPELVCGGESEAQAAENGENGVKRRKVLKDLSIQVAFGLPWTWRSIVGRAVSSRHPFVKGAGVPPELKEAIDKHCSWTEAQLCKFRLDWCKKWLIRSKDLEQREKQDNAMRPPHVASVTSGKRILLTREILSDLDYDDMGVLSLPENGATLAGEIEQTNIFQAQFKPCLVTMEQLESDALRRNEFFLSLTESSGDRALNEQLLAETKEELSCGWAEGPFSVESLEKGATISRRLPLVQGSKTRMIDDFSISGVNDSCIIHNKIDLHLIDTFAAAVRYFFAERSAASLAGSLEGKTYDLKSAYRQVPIRSDHLKFAYFSIYNCEIDEIEIYRLKTLPFGATHSVYNFLRLARMLYTILVKGRFLITTNFYDDFILASPPAVKDSSANSMELVFMLTGWIFAREWKSTVFDTMCKALGGQFDFSKSSEYLMHVENTEARKKEVCELLGLAIKNRRLSMPEALILLGKLGFADSFMHGRLGALVLKKLAEHAYGRSAILEVDLLAWLLSSL